MNLYKATLTPHYSWHNFVTILYRAGVDPMKAMKIVSHSDYQTTADIYTHLDELSMRVTAQDMACRNPWESRFLPLATEAGTGSWRKWPERRGI